MEKATTPYRITCKVLTLTSFLVLTACGGSGGGDSSSEEAGPIVSNSDQPETDQPVTTSIDNTPTADFRNATIQAIMVPLQPAPGIEDGRHGVFITYDVNASGNFIGVGGFSTPDNQSPFSRAIWTGPPTDLELLISTEDTDSSLSAPIPIGRFSGSSKVSIANDGTLGMVVSAAGADGFFNGIAYLMREAGDTLITPVLAEGIALPTATGSPVLNEFLGDVKLSDGGVAFAADVDNDERGLWTYANGSAALVAPGGDTSFAPPLLPGTDCRIFYIDLPELDPFTIDNTGSILFPAVLFPDISDAECPVGGAIVRYTDGEYEAVTTRGERVPGYSDSLIASTSLLDIFPNGDALISIVLDRIGSGSINPDRERSTWRFPKTGEPSLILLGSESFNTDEGTQLLDTCCTFTTGANQEVTLRTGGVSSTGNFLFGGPHRDGQPYSEFFDTGFNDLGFLARDDGPAPSEFPNTYVFDNVQNAEPDSEGSYYFFGRVLNEQDGDVVQESVWRADAGGSISSIVSVGDSAVVLDGSVQRISEIHAGNGSSEEIILTSSGTMIVLAETSGSILNLIPIVVQLE